MSFYQYIKRKYFFWKNKIRKYIKCVNKYYSAGKKKIILMNTPLHGNLGDQAIAIAEKNFLCNFFSDFSLCEIDSDDLIENFNAWKSLIKKNDIIIVHGGGYLGDLWINEEHKFRRIIETYSQNKILVFPQSVYYMDCNEIPKSKMAYKNYYRCGKRKLTVMLRDKSSFDFFNQYFSEYVTGYLVPDIVLSTCYKGTEKRSGVLICFRRDGEVHQEAADLRKQAEQWAREVFGEIKYTDTCVQEQITIDQRERFVNQKLESFSKAKLVITDRLHGMIFSAITGTPCIAFDNISGKVSGGYQWLSDLPYIKLVQNEAKFAEICDIIPEIVKKEYSYDSQILYNEFYRMYQILRNAISEN